LTSHDRAGERQRFSKLCPEESGIRHRPFTKPGFLPLAMGECVAYRSCRRPGNEDSLSTQMWLPEGLHEVDYALQVSTLRHVEPADPPRRLSLAVFAFWRRRFHIRA
jgi:hypothetical protein